MNIHGINQLNNTHFKSIYITTKGQKAIDSYPYREEMDSLKTGIDKFNKKYPETKYWDLIIDGKPEENKYSKKQYYSPVYYHINKVTGENFTNLDALPPTTLWQDYHASSKNHKNIPPELLIFRDESGKEIAADLKSFPAADDKFTNICYQDIGALGIYDALESISTDEKMEIESGEKAEQFIAGKITYYNNINPNLKNPYR